MFKPPPDNQVKFVQLPTLRHCERSEAIPVSCRELRDCRGAARLAMTE